VRLERVSKSPVISFFTETLHGLSQIRAFGHQKRFLRKYFDLIDTNFKYSFFQFGAM